MRHAPLRQSLRHIARTSLAAMVMSSAVCTMAEAKCTRLGFTVNDYGKDGPTNDAKTLLDAYIARWTAQNNIKSYTTGKKDVTCELFLDFGVFDEHTCRAEAAVCWGGSTPAVITAPTAPVTTGATAKPKG